MSEQPISDDGAAGGVRDFELADDIFAEPEVQSGEHQVG